MDIKLLTREKLILDLGNQTTILQVLTSKFSESVGLMSRRDTI
jgi:hypothetical protein